MNDMTTIHRHSFLDTALRRLNEAEIRPDVIQKRIRQADMVLRVSAAVTILVLLILIFDVPASQPARVFTAFAFLLSAGVTLAAALSSRAIVWSAYLREQVTALAKELEVQEMADLARTAMQQLEDEELCAEVCRVVVEHEPPERKEICNRACRRALEVAASVARRRFKDYLGSQTAAA